MYTHLHSGTINTFFTHINVWQDEHIYNVLFKPSNAVTIVMTEGARSLCLWAPISVEMKQNIGRGGEEQRKCVSAKYVLYCRLTALCWQHYAHLVLDPYINNSLQPNDVKEQHISESNFGSDTGLKHVAINPIPNPILAYHQRWSALIYTRQFYKKYPWKYLAIYRKITFNITSISPSWQWIKERDTSQYNMKYPINGE